MLESTPQKLSDALNEGWRVVTCPVESPVCKLAEGYFALALDQRPSVPGAIQALEKIPVCILLEREGVVRRAQIVLDLLLKGSNFGNSNALVKGGLLQGWIVTTDRSLSSFLLARRTVVHDESGEFDEIKVARELSPLYEIAYLDQKDTWIAELDSRQNSRPNAGFRLLNGIELLSAT